MKPHVKLAAALAAATAMLAGAGALSAVSASPLPREAPRYVLPQRGAHIGSATTSNNLVDHGGTVLAASDTYELWWGSASRFPSDAAAGLTALLGGFGGSNYLGIAQQYMRGASITSAFKKSASDPTTPPSRNPSVSTILNEVVKQINAGALPYDASGIYFVYTSNFPKGGNYCAWHSAGQTTRGEIQVAYMPNTTGIAGCDPGTTFNLTSYSQGTRSLANVTAHEFMEAVTDPIPTSGWADNSGSEIGDKCAWTFSATVNLPGSAGWMLQQEWSNALTGCAQGA